MNTKLASLSLIILFVIVLVFSGCTENTDNRFIKAAYDNEPRLENGHLNVSGLIYWIKENNLNTYNYLIWHSEYDWEDLPGFLEEAEKEGIDVWITVSPPQEKISEPFGIDYMRWAEEIAKLSLEHPSIKAWSIDNFLLFAGQQQEEYFSVMFSKTKEINPKLQFIPVVYLTDVQSSNFGLYRKYFDGVQFYYKVFPTPDGFGGYQECENQLAYVKTRFDKKIILGIYASPWQREYPTTPNYVKELIKTAKKSADGVMIYTLQKDGGKLDVIKEEFK